MRPRDAADADARSSAMEPVGIESTFCFLEEPSFMIEPRPNCFSIARIAASTARVRSVDARSMAMRSLRSTPLPSTAPGLLDPLIAIEFLLPGPAISDEI
jgi:hypothetical protein